MPGTGLQPKLTQEHHQRDLQVREENILLQLTRSADSVEAVSALEPNQQHFDCVRSPQRTELQAQEVGHHHAVWDSQRLIPLQQATHRQ